MMIVRNDNDKIRNDNENIMKLVNYLVIDIYTQSSFTCF